jgi:hypothetical protein
VIVDVNGCSLLGGHGGRKKELQFGKCRTLN